MRLELRNVRKRFGKAEALRGIDLEVPAGRRLALVGPNGSGKSTLIRAVLGLIACEGEVLLDGRSPFQDRLLTARRLAYVPQVAPNLPAAVGELVDLVAETREIDRRKIEELGAELELDVVALRSRPFRGLSGGMKQKLLIALALAPAPELLILDEPTASLDGAGRACFARLLEQHGKGATLLLCSHRLEEIRQLAEHVVVLAEGKVAHAGPAAEYLAVRPVAVEGPPGSPVARLDGTRG